MDRASVPPLLPGSRCPAPGRYPILRRSRARRSTSIVLTRTATPSQVSSKERCCPEPDANRNARASAALVAGAGVVARAGRVPVDECAAEGAGLGIRIGDDNVDGAGSMRWGRGADPRAFTCATKTATSPVAVCKEPTPGKFADSVSPVTKALPEASRAMPYATSERVPPRKVE